jgi:dihydrolipoamide dehydrogenase
MAEQSFDVIMIGGGPGGYVAAIRAAQLGLRAAVVEREHLGGICLNWGCIPAKALLRASELRHLMGELADFGLVAGEVRLDMARMVRRSREVADKLSKGVAYLLKKNKVTVFDAHGRLGAKQGAAREVKLDGKNERLLARHVILATGARARTLPGITADGKLVWTYKEAMIPESLPRSIVVIGAGAIGMEFASFYRDLGSDVTVIEAMDRILPVEDAEISRLARAAFEKQGIVFHASAKLTALDRGKDSVTARVDSGGKEIAITAARAILSVGIAGNVENIGIEGTRVRVEKSHVAVNRWCETDEPGVYAIGDLVGPPWLAHKASHEGIVCVERIAGHGEVRPLDVTNIPSCTYCRPQIASVGLSEEAAKGKGGEIRVGRFPYRANGKAIALGEPDGLVKTVFDGATGELLGAHIIGAEATELIQGFAIARTLEATEADLIATVFPHPTLSEAMGEAVLDAWGRALHV